MTLVTNSGNLHKVKNIHVALEGFASAAGATSNFGNGSDINCTDVEYTTLTLPEKTANNSTEVTTNLRTLKDTSATDSWDDWSGMGVFADENSVNSKAFVAAQETDATGTVTITIGAAKAVWGKWQAKISKSGGGGGDANSFNTSFSPTFCLIKSLAQSGT